MAIWYNADVQHQEENSKYFSFVESMVIAQLFHFAKLQSERSEILQQNNLIRILKKIVIVFKAWLYSIKYPNLPLYALMKFLYLQSCSGVRKLMERFSVTD